MVPEPVKLKAQDRTKGKGIPVGEESYSSFSGERALLKYPINLVGASNKASSF